jgi:ion channel-forming bestrophin family protein
LIKDCAMLMTDEKRWFKIALQVKGSVILSILPRVLLCAGFGAIVVYAHTHGLNLAFPGLAALIPNLVLGLLLVFRTNTAYDRFWEGRKSWGTIVVNTRNLARQIWVAVDEPTAIDRQDKIAALRLLESFALATKDHLRQLPISPTVASLVSIDQSRQLSQSHNPPLEIAFWISDYLQTEYRQGKLHVQQLTAMQLLLDRMSEALGSCERILRTPMPLAYSIHLKQLLLLYCLSLPFQMVEQAKWGTPVFVAIISFMLFGIEAIGIEIENPFGTDPNDLPLDTICQTIGRNVEDLIQLEPRRLGRDNLAIGATQENL